MLSVGLQRFPNGEACGGAAAISSVSWVRIPIGPAPWMPACNALMSAAACAVRKRNPAGADGPTTAAPNAAASFETLPIASEFGLEARDRGSCLVDRRVHLAEAGVDRGPRASRPRVPAPVQGLLHVRRWSSSGRAETSVQRARSSSCRWTPKEVHLVDQVASERPRLRLYSGIRRQLHRRNHQKKLTFAFSFRVVEE